MNKKFSVIFSIVIFVSFFSGYFFTSRVHRDIDHESSLLSEGDLVEDIELSANIETIGYASDVSVSINISAMKIIAGKQDEEYLTALRDTGFDTFHKLSFKHFEGQNPLEGVYDFSVLEHNLRICREVGLQAIPTLGIWRPPIWYKDKFPDCVARSKSGKEIGLFNYPYGLISNFWLAENLIGSGEASKYIRNYIREFFQILNRYPEVVVGVDLGWRGFRGRCDIEYNFGYFDEIARSEWNYDFELPASYSEYENLTEVQQEMFRKWVMTKSGEVFNLLLDEMNNYMDKEDWLIITMHYWGDHRRSYCTGLDRVSFLTFLEQVTNTGFKRIIFSNDAGSWQRNINDMIETHKLVDRSGFKYCNVYNIARGNRSCGPLKTDKPEIPIEDFFIVDDAVNPDIIGILGNGEGLKQIKDIVDKHRLSRLN